MECHESYFFWQGNTAITGSRDATREAFSNALVSDGEGWMEMIKSRNQSFHTYNQELAEQIAGLIMQRYHPLFVVFESRMRGIKAGL